MNFSQLKSRLLPLIAFIFVLQLSYSQNRQRADSLIQVLKSTQDFRAKTRILLNISNEEKIRDPGKSFKYAQEAQQIAQRIDYDSAEVRAMILMGANYSRMTLLKEAIEIGEQIIEKATRYNMKLEIADGRSIMAVAYSQVGDFDNSSRLYFENLKLYEKLNEKKQLGRTLGNIGADFLEQHSYVKALEYTNKALNIGLETNNLTLVTDQYNNLAAIYQVGFSDFTKAMQNYVKALEVALKIEDFQQQGGIMLNMGRIYMKLNKSDSALFYFNRAFYIFKELNNPVFIADSYTALGDFYFQSGDYAKGKKFALYSLKIGKENGILQTIFNASYLLYNLSLAGKDSLAAFKYHILLTNTKDSLYVLQNKKEIYKLEFQYHQEKMLKEQKMRQQRYYFILGFMILGLLSSLAFIMLLNSRQKIKIKNANLEKEKAESDLKFKSKELSINLLALLKKSEMISVFSKKLSELENSPSGIDFKEAAKRLNNEIKQSTDERLWQEFSIRFKETNSEFDDKLLKNYPDLWPSELKLCAYLRLNLSTKEISDLTGQRTEAIEKARYRLRKKFGLTNSESNLVTFLTQI